MPTSTEWNARYQVNDEQPVACEVLANYTHLLPTTGKALDLACGLGANARLLSQYGLETHAWDYADVAIAQLQQRAPTIHTQVKDIIQQPPTPATYDVIVVCHFLERALIRPIINALKPNGLLFYQTFIQEQVSDRGPKRAEFRLSNNELLQLCHELRLLIYHEEGRVGNLTQGFRDQVLFIGQKL